MDLKESIKENKFLILIAIIVGIACLYQSGGLHFLFQGYQELFMVQYAGALHTQYAGWWNNDRFNSDTIVEIGDYRFETVKYDQYWVDYGCQENTCGGTFDHNDEFGCPVYKKVTPSGTYCCFTGESGCRVWYCRYPKSGGSKYGTGSGCGYITSGNVVSNVYTYGCAQAVYKSGSTEYCGGSFTGCSDEEGYINWGCSYLVKVYKDNNLIETIGHDEGCGSDITGNSKFSTDEIEADFGTQKWFFNHECKSILNSYNIKIPDNSFNISIYSPEEYYVQGEDAIVNIKIINNWEPVRAKVSVKICQPTFGIPHCETYTQTKDLVVGENELSYSIPTKYAVEKLEVTPVVDLYLDLNTFSLKGLNIEANRLLNNNLQNYANIVGGGLINTDLAKNDGYTLYGLGSVSGELTEVEIKPIITAPIQPGIWDKIGDFFASIMIWVSGLFW